MSADTTAVRDREPGADRADDADDTVEDFGDDVPRRLSVNAGVADAAFRGVILAAGSVVLVIMLLVALFLSIRAVSALQVAGWNFFTETDWSPETGTFGIVSIITGTVLIGLTAIVVAFPLAFGTALYISEYAPASIKGALVNLVDLMAAVPSVVYGLWGFYLLQPYIFVTGQQGEGLPRWLATYFGWIPFLSVTQAGAPVDPRDPLTSGTIYASSTFIAGVVVAMMVAPIACSIMRENFSQAPLGEREGAYALGATKWGMIRSVVLPFGTGGIIGGTMLGLGRALGETIAVVMIISLTFEVQYRILQTGTSSVSSLIALRYGEAQTETALSALMAAGLALFTMTLIINFGAAAVIARSRSGASS